MKKLILFLLILVCGATAVQAQQPAKASAVQQMHLNMADAIELTFVASNSNAGNNVDMVFGQLMDFVNGVTSTQQNLRVRSNKNFAISVKTNSANFSYTGNALIPPVIPVSNVLKVNVVSNSTGGLLGGLFNLINFATLSLLNQNLINNCQKGGDQTFGIKYQTVPGLSYPSGSYAVDVVFTATQL